MTWDPDSCYSMSKKEQNRTEVITRDRERDSLREQRALARVESFTRKGKE